MTATTLSTSLREGTHDSHRLAEQTPFIRSLFQGQLSLEAYREFMLQLLHVNRPRNTQPPFQYTMELNV